MPDEQPSGARFFPKGMVGFGEDYYRLLFEHAGMAMVATDAQFDIQSWNRATSRMFGAPAGRMVGTSLLTVIPKEGRDDAERALRDALERGVTSQFEFMHRDEKERPRQLAVTVSPIPDREGTRVGALACFRDITTRMRLAEELADHRKMASLGEMAGAMAHHFNNILGGIVTSVDYALATSDSDIRYRVLQKTAQALSRATRLVDSLLAFAEGDRRHADTGDLTETVISLADQIEPEMAERGVDLELEIDPIPPMPVYRKQVDTILLNLVENAVQAMADGGTLMIRLGPADNQVRLEVADSGCGMTEEEAARVFEPFYSGSRSGPGARRHREGLGLAVVHGIVQEMGGSITVTTAPGRGTTLRILFPRPTSTAQS